MKLLHKGLILISVPLAFELLFAFGFNSLLQRSMDRLHAEVHAKQVIALAERIQILLSESSILIGLKGAEQIPAVDRRYEEIWESIKENYRSLKAVAGKKTDAHLVQGVKTNITRIWKVQNLGLMNRARRRDDGESGPMDDGTAEYISSYFLNWYEHRKQYEAHSGIGALITAELRSVVQGPKLYNDISKQFRNFLIFGALGDIVIVLSLALFFGTNIERRLKNLMETTRRMAKTEDLSPPLQGDDELAKLDLLLHDTAATIIETQKFKKQLLGVVCHELKAPLSAVKLLLARVLEDVGSMSDKARSALKRASTSCNRLQIMVTELLDLESMNAEKIKLNYKVTKPAAVLESAVEMVRDMARDQNLELIVDSCDTAVEIDPDRFNQVIVNLLSNAIKFSPRGEKILLTAKELENELEISVKDHGPGIPEELHESLFEVFTQAEQPKDAKIKGTGMGLSISKAIVQAHVGSIKIISSPGNGATFRILIPKKASQTSGSAVSAAGNSVKVGLSKKQGMRFRIRHKGLLLIGLPFLTQIILFSSFAVLLQQANVQLENQTTARRVVSESEALVSDLANAAILVLLTGASKVDRSPILARQEADIKASFSQFQKTCAGDPERESDCRAIEKAVLKINDDHRYIVDEQKKRKLTVKNAAAGMVEEYLDAWNVMSNEVDTLAAREESLQSKNEKNLEGLALNLDKLLIAGLAVNILGAIGLTAFLAQNIGKRINRVQDNAERILEKQALLSPVEGRDEIAELDKAFHDAAEALKQEQQLKQKLLAIASHELRSPLASILMSLNMLSLGAFGDMSEKNMSHLKQAESGTERLIALINDILDIEKMEAGKFVLSIENLQSHPLVDRAIACVLPLAQKKNISIENSSEDRLIKADAERLTQVLINLLTNAVKFSSEGQQIRIDSHVNSNGQFIITIEDSGAGMEKEVQEKIFDAFVSKKDDQNLDGTGLGLPISKAIIEQHGGSIGCHSERGKGSTFWFSLPLAIAS